jgi:hypothetical protein
MGTYKDKTFKPTNKIVLQEFCCREDAQKAEISLHDFYKVDVNPHFANRARARSTGFSCGYSRKLSEETKRKIGEANKIALKGKKLPDEVKAKIGARFRGKPLTEEHKRKMSEAQRGRQFGEQHLQNLRNGIKNRKYTDEQKKRLKEINEKPIILKKINTEEILKFPSRAAAGLALGIPASTISNAIRRGQKTVHTYEICAIF